MNRFLIATTAFFILVFTVWYNKLPNEEKLVQEEEETVELLPEHPYYLLEDVNDTVLYKTLCHYQFPNPEIITAQAVLETGNFKSRLCLDGNNLFGLYDSKNKQYFKFDSWISCVLAYKDYILAKYDNEQNYLHFLQSINYAEDPNYLKKVKELSNKYKNIK